MYRTSAFVLFFLLIGIASAAQPCMTDAAYIADPAVFRQSVMQDARKQMVNISAIPGLIMDLRYATANNFTHTVLYRHPVPMLRAEAAAGLRQAQEELRKKGLGIKLFDAYRPFSVSCKMWRLAPDRHYVANPRKGSNHNRGLAVDVTLIDLKTGHELDMGIGFDNFTDSAHHDFTRLPPQVLANRMVLKTTLRKYGFGPVPAEWWHYQYHNDAGYEVLDLDFDELAAQAGR